MTKRFKEVYPNIIRSNYCFTDNGKGIGDKEVVDLLNEQHERIKTLENEIKDFQDLLANKENELLKPIMNALDEAIQNERTKIGQSVLKQFKERIQ